MDTPKTWWVGGERCVGVRLPGCLVYMLDVLMSKAFDQRAHMDAEQLKLKPGTGCNGCRGRSGGGQ